MTSTYTPDREVRDALVTALRADPDLRDLLFPSWSPSLGPTDYRVYDVHGTQRPEANLRNVLPRVNIDATWNPDAIALEQPTVNLRGAVTVTLYAIVPAERKDFGARFTARVAAVVASTRLSGARIIAADLYVQGAAPAESLVAFSGAWQFRLEFRSAEVEVLV